MSLPTFASIPLCRSTHAQCAGGAFQLQDPARESEIVLLDGWEVEVRERVHLVVARGGSESNFNAAVRGALLRAQRALDLMAVRGANNLMIKGFDDEHLAWWPEPAGLVIRIVSLAPFRFDVPPITGTVTDAANAVGNVVPQASAIASSLAWHESFRYFRLSQTTDDLFDAYRNAYLALESVLSAIAPQQTGAPGRVHETESEWFKRALTEADRIVPLSSVVQPRVADPIPRLFDELYRDMRSAMSHAKSGRKILLPQNEDEREDVTNSLRRLVALYLKLAEAHLGARRLNGGVSPVGFRMMLSPMLEQMTVHVTDDESPFDESDKAPNPAGGKLEALVPQGPPDESAPFVVTRLWAAEPVDLAELPFIRRVVGLVDEVAGMAAVLEGRLELGSAHRLEIVVGARGSNTRRPRERYSF